MKTDKKKLLLHTCCAPCSTSVLEKLAGEYEITGFFYNPNIHPEDEHGMRLEEARAFYSKKGIPIIEEEYEEELWHELVKGHEEDPELGERCTICYRMRLEKTAEKAVGQKFDVFGTVLTISPHKDAERINDLGVRTGEEFGIPFLVADFKKKDGYKRSVEISREEGLYRQNYCGCIHSRRGR
jgi:predicted adenine nucleotide alpha hydrolase (AANH) superfamily ATPase